MCGVPQWPVVPLRCRCLVCNLLCDNSSCAGKHLLASASNLQVRPVGQQFVRSANEMNALKCKTLRALPVLYTMVKQSIESQIAECHICNKIFKPQFWGSKR